MDVRFFHYNPDKWIVKRPTFDINITWRVVRFVKSVFDLGDAVADLGLRLGGSNYVCGEIVFWVKCGVTYKY